MKRLICILSCFSLTLLMGACSNPKQEIPVLSSTVSAPSSTISVISEPISSTTAESKPSSKPATSSKIKEQKTTSKPQKPLDNSPIKVRGFTVNDPYNQRGLSTKKKGFSFGVAKNEKPHSQSLENQKRFDKYKNVSALALDTKTTEKVMYLTFDNGYEYKNLTADILDTLKKKQVKAAFFVTLSYAKDNPKLMRRMIDEGHIVGNHSTTHPSFPGLTRKKMAKEIGELNDYLQKNFSYTSPYFRFPMGEYSENSLELVTSIGFNSVFWSVAYNDWDTSAQNGKDYAFSTVTSRFHPGAVILLHAVSKDNAKALGKIIDAATDKGYTFASLDDYFQLENKEIIPE